MNHEYGTSRWAQGAAILLMACGVVLMASVIVPNNYGFGLPVAGVGIPYLVAGVFAWRHHLWARLLGLLVGVVGILVGVGFWQDAFYPAAEPGSTWPALRMELVVSPVLDVAIIVGLLLGGRHFRRQG